MINLVIDARLYGPKHTGLGRYTKNLLIALKDKINFKEYRVTLLVYPELESEIRNDLGNSFSYITTNLKHYSLKEQLFLPSLLYKLKPDLVHFTHLDKPLLYFGKSVVTVHDLIRHFSKGSQTSTRNPLFYWPKYFGYLLMTRVILKNSYIIVPSNFWRDYIIDKYNFNPQKIITTYEAVDPEFLKNSIQTNIIKNQNYLIYTGNLYPHKNIEIIFKALQKLPNLSLKIICARPLFYDRIKKQIDNYQISKQVEFMGYLPDKEFQKIYQQAMALVHPSFLEGFSLTGLEAMSLNCPVISSNSSCLPEIYENSVLYFNPNKSSELIKQIKLLQKSPKIREKLIKLGHQQVSKYSWTDTATKTFQFYQKILHD